MHVPLLKAAPWALLLITCVARQAPGRMADTIESHVSLPNKKITMIQRIQTRCKASLRIRVTLCVLSWPVSLTHVLCLFFMGSAVWPDTGPEWTA